MSNFESTWRRFSAQTEIALKSRLTDRETMPKHLHQAMEYVCLDGGKRFRAMLVFACGEVAGASLDRLETPACAVEMVHAYSLTHDDLPAMDDDDFRRGRPSCHVKFDEPTAILVGDALQSRAFEILASDQWNNIDPAHRIRMVEQLAVAIGSIGMAGGQALDMMATGNAIGFTDLVKIHKLKTGALITSAAIIGGLAAPKIDETLINIFAKYASSLGLAFQIADDILDATADSETLGKSSGADSRMQKATYVSVLGLDLAIKEAQKLSNEAIESIQCLGDNRSFLEQLAKFVITRNY